MNIQAPQFLSSILAISIFFSILILLRKDRITHRDGFKWLILAVAILVYGLFPRLNDWIGESFGISYPPIIPLLIGFSVLLIKLLIADIERARLQVTVNRLVQKVAILEHKIDAKK